MVAVVVLRDQLLRHYLLALMVRFANNIRRVIVVAVHQTLQGGGQRRRRWVVSIDCVVEELPLGDQVLLLLVGRLLGHVMLLGDLLLVDHIAIIVFGAVLAGRCRSC